MPITLTPPEALLRRLLIDCREASHDVPGMKGCELRFSGGWVRDKLLGSASHDIDISLSSMTGEAFGLSLQSYMKSNMSIYEAEAKRHGLSSAIRQIAKIEANPEKSKHLATATTKIFGIDVDFVNLRKEVYNDDSRNPQMEFGTPEEDAMRRDATVNALFYNLDTQTVEDFTLRGLDDMAKHIIRTPLEPYQTFKDDPLRVLRLIRFAARLGYTIEPDVLASMADPRIRDELRRKISRERILVEVSKIMIGRDAYGGLKQIYDLDLYQTVFADPASKDAVIDESLCAVALDSLRILLDRHGGICLGLKPKNDILLSWLIACYIPWHANEMAAITAAREGLRLSTAHMKVIGDSVRNRGQLDNLIRTVESNRASRRQVGMALRNAGKQWRAQVLYSLLYDTTQEPFDDVIRRYTTFVTYVQDQGLENAANLKPIINGDDVMKALGISKAGPWLGKALEMVTEWQFENPAGTAQGARDMIISRKAELDP